MYENIVVSEHCNLRKFVTRKYLQGSNDNKGYYGFGPGELTGVVVKVLTSEKIDNRSVSRRIAETNYR